MRGNRRLTGQRGEEAAARFLQEMGYQILQRNFYTRYGEIDLVALEGETLVFVEVRSRSTSGYGRAVESINRRKKAHLHQAALVYLTKNSNSASTTVAWKGLRFDVVTVEYGIDGSNPGSDRQRETRPARGLEAGGGGKTQACSVSSKVGEKTPILHLYKNAL